MKRLEDEVMGGLQEWSQALRNKNLDAHARCYAENVRVFDLGTQMIGYEWLHALSESCLPHFPNPIETE